MSLGFKVVDDVDFRGKRVLMRAEFNVPLDANGKITDDIRIQKTIPTIRKILEDEPEKLVLMAHLGRPKGQVVPEMSLAPVAKRLSELLAENVSLAPDCVDIELPNTRIVLLENLRFHKEETEGDEEFGKKLASYGDIFVSDAFGVVHRAHASVAIVPNYIPSVAGYLIEHEISTMSKIIDDPVRPFSFILGCAKLDKIALIERMLEKADNLLLGGAVVFTFLKAQGIEVGKSLVDDENLETARNLYIANQDKIILPDDFIVAKEKDEDSEMKVVDKDGIPPDMIGLDIGPESIEKFKMVLRKSKTVVWNGPLGVYEIERFSKSTKDIGEFITELPVDSLIGGGDTASAAKKFNLTEKFTHVSSGGGASLAFIQGDPLPGIEALKDRF